MDGSEHTPENPFHGLCQKMERTIREFALKNDGKPMLFFYQLKCKLRGLEPKQFDGVLATLIEQGKVSCHSVDRDGAGRPATGYLAV